MSLIDNVFNKNSAKTINNMEESGHGGAMYFECPSNNCSV